jgi:hypothetical protein
LVGVIAGALTAFGGQYLMRRTERQERYSALLLEQFALIIALSEDFQGRVWEERHQVASDVVGKRDWLTLRLAHARLRVLSHDPKVMAAFRELYDAGAIWTKPGGSPPLTRWPLTTHIRRTTMRSSAS